MENIFVEFLPPWIETGLQPAFYDKESGTVLQQTARMYARVNMLIRMFNKLSRNTKTEIERFETAVNEDMTQYKHDINETVADYIEQFNQLHDYVHDYFDNLDVQEEINNKLDDMVEQGTLQEIITTYIQSNVAWTFDNVAEMKLATNLTDDSFAQTIGFYSANDKGGALYKIRAKTSGDTVDEMTLIDLYDNTLVAELIKTNTMNVKQFGAKGDGTTDDTSSIQTAFTSLKNINIPSGTYMIDGTNPLIPSDNSKITLDNDATLKVITTAQDTYRAIHILNKNNVEISGGTIQGERATHTGSGGEWGVGIRIYGTSTNIYIHDITVKDTWGDGITVATSGNVKTEHVHIDNARRNGYSIISVNEFISNDDIIENTGGTNPQAGVDIEPDTASNILTNVVFNNLMTKNNLGGGMLIYLMAFDNTSSSTNIVINNLYDYGSKYGIKVTKNIHTKGLITIDKPYLESSKDSGICLWGCYDSDLALKINKPYILNCDTGGQGALYGAGISGYVLEADSIAEAIGNIEIVEPYITSAYANQTTAIGLRNYKNDLDVKVNNVKIINPINLGGDQIYIDKPTNLYFIDEYNVTKFSTNSSYTIPSSEYYSLYSNREATTATRTLTIPDTITTIGRKLRFRNMNPTYALFIKLPTTDYCHQLSNNLSPTITLAKIGDTIELERLTATEWIVSDINFTPNVS